MRGNARNLIAIVALASSVGAWGQGAGNGAVPDVAGIERRLGSVETLIERSSAARQIESAGNAAAAERRQEARATHRLALEAYRSGDLSRTSELLSKASLHMMAAARLAAPGDIVNAKQRTDFKARLESAKALLAAQRRIAAEKAGTPDAAESARAVEGLIAEAESQATNGSFTKARATLDQAYLLVKASVSSMRSGDTLVRSLSFATPEDEYHYEVDRNDTHRMLLKVLLDASRTAQATGASEKAAELREKAEAAAHGADYPGAIRLLEESTRELVRAIRAAGIYIPG